jgi:alkanesulfonate monooxygenase SsuD/methylene tetrahydromethanopterin reductase-like flavin-dependent oxidoreductase (luciferase family)
VSKTIGVAAGSTLSPEQAIAVIRAAEAASFDEAWVAEDLGCNGAFAIAASALMATRRLPIGLGITSVALRHPLVLAQEIAVLARLHPGRFRPGLAVGARRGLEAIGLWPRRQLELVEEQFDAVRRLLEGDQLSGNAGRFHLGGAGLEFPPAVPVSLYMAGSGPRMLELSGRLAHGTIASAGASPKFIAWARERVDAGAAGTHRPLVAYALFAIDRDPDTARATLRSAIGRRLEAALGSRNHIFLERSLGEDLAELATAFEAQGARALSEPLASGRFDHLGIAGDAPECAAQVRAYWEAGADCVALYPLPPDQSASIIEIAGRNLLPLLR